MRNHTLTVSLLALLGCLSSTHQPRAEDDPRRVDQAPSGHETSRTYVGDRSNVTLPGRDTVIDTREPGRQHLDFKDGTREQDRTYIDQRTRR